MKNDSKPDEMGNFSDIEKDLASLARLASSESSEDVRLFLARLVRKYRQGNPVLAAQLDQSLRNTHTRSSPGSILRRGAAADPSARAGDEEGPVDRDSRLALIRQFDDRQGIAAPLLPPTLLGQIESIIREREQRQRLLARGIGPTRSAILVGPPGVGKTLSARWIASRLNKPLWVLDLTAVMSSLLGKTGTNLRAAFDHAKANSAVLLLDEIDAIAKRRSDESDIGELKRLVTVILQEVDQWPDTGLLLAATNHPELVDPALWRRFEAVLEFGQADATATLAAIKRFLGDDLPAFEPWIDVMATGLRGQSLSDVERSITTMRRAMALHDESAEELVRRTILSGQTELTRAQRQELAFSMAAQGKLSHHEISRLTGVSRDTIRKHVGPSPRQGRGLK